MTVHFVHVSDTHIGPTPEYCLHGANTHRRTQAIVQAINRLADSGHAPVDFVVHTGDVTTDGDQPDRSGDSGSLAADLLQPLTRPLYLINGNHDDRRDLGRCFPASVFGQPWDADLRAYQFQYNDRLFLALDARPWPIDVEFDPRGRIVSTQLDALRQRLSDTTLRTTLFLHYPPVAVDCRWIDDWMMVKYEPPHRSLHDILVAERDKIDGVFFGHVHRGLQVLRDGILYASVGAASCHFEAFPELEGPKISSSDVAFFNYVALTPLGTIIKQHWVDV